MPVSSFLCNIEIYLSLESTSIIDPLLCDMERRPLAWEALIEARKKVLMSFQKT